MPQFSTKRRVHHAAAEMFALVADVERYPEFVPLCRDLEVLSRKNAGHDIEVITARMTVAYHLVRESFTSRVTLDRPRLNISVEYLDGPFRHMENRWFFQAISEHFSEVEFFIAYEFRSRMLGALMGSVFDAAFRKFAEAFERRADAVYA